MGNHTERYTSSLSAINHGTCAQNCVAIYCVCMESMDEEAARQVLSKYDNSTKLFSLAGIQCWCWLVENHDADTCQIVFCFQNQDVHKIIVRLSGVDSPCLHLVQCILGCSDDGPPQKRSREVFIIYPHEFRSLAGMSWCWPCHDGTNHWQPLYAFFTVQGLHAELRFINDSCTLPVGLSSGGSALASLRRIPALS